MCSTHASDSGHAVAFLSTLFFPISVSKFVNLMSLVSGVICIQLFLAVQNSSFCCLILQIGVSDHIILMYYLNYEHTTL